jgi:3-hydroxyisobutyrate dehydrogenase-like beta-hydroxyacid dehydrogenase
MTDNTIKTIGVIGLGAMGLPMTRHLLSGGFSVVAYDVNEKAMAAATAEGASTAASPADVAKQCDLVIVVVGFDSQVIKAVTGEDGLLAGARPGMIIAVASTVSPATMKGLAAADGDGAIHFVDAPLCRGAKAAQDGTLLVMGGGDQAAFEICRPAFSTFADAIFHLGGAGAGQVGKMVNNLLLWASISIDIEGLKLGRALGVDEEILRQALLQSSGNNWALQNKIWEQPMPWAEKDMTIVLKEADDLRIALPLSGTVREVIKGIKIELGSPTPAIPKD